MPKGRRYVPDGDHDGIWFQHRGLPDPGPLRRETSTCTGVMLTAPFREGSANVPAMPPPKYLKKDAINFQDSNDFSRHDNRNSFQDHGVYFADGRTNRTLGKNLMAPDSRQHYTDKHFLKHLGRVVVDHDYKTINSSDYRGRPTETPPVHRRFPRIHKEGDPGPTPLSTTTTLWQGGAPDSSTKYRTPTQVLAITQEPFLPSNKWKYSNHGLPKCYPQYDHLKTKRNLYTEWKLDAPHIAHLNAKLKMAS